MKICCLAYCISINLNFCNCYIDGLSLIATTTDVDKREQHLLIIIQTLLTKGFKEIKKFRICVSTSLYK